MIEISFGHKIENDILVLNKLSIGHGLPRHGQLDFISLTVEEINTEGVVIYATYRWGFGFWRVKKFFKSRGRMK